jgi:HlyD family secretion protein
MTTGRKVLIGILVVIVLAVAATLSVKGSRDRGIEVRIEEVTSRDLVETVTASGNIRAGRVVDISSDVSARVAELLIDEGDDVKVGQLLLRLDPTKFDAAVSRARAALNQSQAMMSQQEANREKAWRDLQRLEGLYQRDSLLVARQQLEDARTNFDLADRQLEASRFGVEQAQASLEETEERLSKTIFTAPIDGKVTRLNVEEGETVIVGTMNNPGSLVLTISELSRVEAVVQVDETDVPYIALGDSAVLELDAFPKRTFAGRVTEIGNSAILPPSQSSSQQTAVDFEVVITIADPPGGIRPDLSATADIVTSTSEDALAVPIIALTVRSRADLEAEESDDDDASEAAEKGSSHAVDDDVEGVFVVRDGEVEFVEVEVGITGEEHFEILSGLSLGDSIVVGPYARIRELTPGDAVRQESRAGGEG